MIYMSKTLLTSIFFFALFTFYLEYFLIKYYYIRNKRDILITLFSLQLSYVSTSIT